MIARVVAFCAERSLLVIALASMLLVAGVFAQRSLQRDVVPDLGDPQIGVIAEWMGHPATEVAGKVTDVLTGSLREVPGANAVRGSSMAGMAYVTVAFDSPALAFAGRRAIVERIERLRATLPPELRIQTGPDVSSAGWVYQYALVYRVDTEDPLNQTRLRNLQETVLRPALQAVPGVAEVATVGGDTPAIVVEMRADHLEDRGIAFSDVISAVRAAIRSNDQEDASRLEQLSVVASAPEGSVRLAELGRVRVGQDMPSGIADLNGRNEAVGGVVLVERPANSVAVVEAVKRALAEQREKLPSGVQTVTVYDRTELAARVDWTLLRALAEEVAVVVVVLLVFLLDGRSAIVPLMTLAATLALTFIAMRLASLPATIMSLGGIGIALGLAVDADVVALEACHRRIESPGANRRAELVAAAAVFAPAIVTSLAITAIAFIPVFAFGGETGRLLRPLALTKTLVIGAAALLSMTLGPALRDRLLRGRVVPEFGNALTRTLVRVYGPVVRFALSRPALTLVTSVLAVASCLPLLPRLGGEFLPRIDEGELLFMPTTQPGISAELAASQMRRQERILRTFPEVESVFGKVGRADTATDPAPFSMAEMTIRLSPRSGWPSFPRARFYSSWAPTTLRRALALVWPESKRETTAELIDRLDAATTLQGWTNAWTMPVRARMDMQSTGVRTPVAMRLVAASTERLTELGQVLRALAEQVPGARSAVFESAEGQPWLHFQPDAGAEARLGADPSLVESTAALLVAGGQIGDAWSGSRRVRVRIVSDLQARGPADRLRDATVRAATSPQNTPIPLALLGRTSYESVPSIVRSEGGQLVAYVQIDTVEGADPTTFVGRARDALDRAVRAGEISFGPGERVDWIGQYPLFVASRNRLCWILPVMGAAMIALLSAQFRSLTEAGIVLVSVPFALVGSVWTLYLLGYALSAPVWVGVLSATGLALQTGVVVVVYIDRAFYKRLRQGEIVSRDDIVEAHAEGTIKRLRPKLMTVTTMAAGLLPLLWGDGAGSEVLRRVAAPMLGGLATSAFLTLEVLPVLYTIWRVRQLRTAHSKGVPLADVVGRAPSWASEC